METDENGYHESVIKLPKPTLYPSISVSIRPNLVGKIKFDWSA